MRATGVTQVALGLLVWAGWAPGVVPAHMGIGLLFVLAVEALALAAARAGAGRRFGASLAVAGLVTLGFGIVHGRLLPGPWHWAVRLAHLLIGIGTMALANGVASRVRGRRGP